MHNRWPIGALVQNWEYISAAVNIKYATHRIYQMSGRGSLLNSIKCLAENPKCPSEYTMFLISLQRPNANPESSHKIVPESEIYTYDCKTIGL